MEKAYPRYITRKVKCLDGLWDFNFLGKVDLSKIDLSNILFSEKMLVPAAFDAMPAYVGQRGTAAYKIMLSIPSGKVYRLQFEAISMWCRIYVDRKAILEHGCGYSGFTCDIPAADHVQREVILLVDNRFDLDRTPLHEPYYDFYQWGGIIRSVWLHELPEVAIDSVKVVTKDVGKGEVEIKVRLTGNPHPPLPMQIEVNDTALTDSDFTISQQDSCFTINIPNPTPWSPDAPNLYKLRIIIPGDDMIVRSGLRQVQARDGKIYLNGNPLKLKGYNRHESHPNFGPSIPYSLHYSDLQLIKDLGCNFVRGSHYQQDQRFLDLCDEQGILVWEEALGWQPQERHFLNPNYIEKHYLQIKEMVEVSFNHPSIIFWGFMNEAHTECASAVALFSDTIKFIKGMDATRIVTYATCRLRQDLCLEHVDIIALNIYPGWYPGWGEVFNEENPVHLILPAMRGCMQFLKDNGMGDRAVIFSEIGADAIYGWRDVMKGHWTEEYQAEYLNTVLSEIMTNPEISGVSLWQFCDIRSASNFYALGRPRAFNNKGTVDEYRRPKQAYEVVKKWFHQ